jgi:undecaprenyl-diphosphatase
MMRAMTWAQTVLARFDLAEYRLCRSFNSRLSRGPLLPLLRVASRIGNGLVWYLLMLLLPLLYGAAGLRCALVMAAAGGIGVLLYRWLKHRLVRERPFIRHPGITLAMTPLDRYSFPSGHTLHAVSFAWQASVHFPELAWVLLPFAALIASSRVVLGLHYPSDVLAGAAIGGALAELGLAFT